MKNNKFHKLPLQTTFLKKIEAGVQYFNHNHNLNFDTSSLEITPLQYSSHNKWPIDSMLQKALKTLNLSNPKHLTRLKITIEDSSFFSMSTIRQFEFSLTHHFKALKLLDLRFLSCDKMNVGNMRLLLDSLTKKMKSLTEVSIYFLACPNLDDQCLYDLKSSIVKRCKKLQKLKILINGFTLAHYDRGLAYFEPNLDVRLQNENLITGFESDMKQNQITSKGGNSLCRCILRYLKRLKSLTFKMTTSEEEEDMKLTKGIFEMIVGLKNLENLNYSGADFLNIDDEYLAQLVSTLGKNKKKLQSLSLNILLETMVSETGLQQFAHNLFLSLPRDLRYLALDLESCPEVTDDLLIEIGSNIANNLKNLQTLLLSFYDMDELTDSALSGLTHVISKGLPSLKNFLLSFHCCHGIIQSFPIVLPERIEQFDLYLYRPKLRIHKTWENLTRLSLTFGGCRELNSFVDLFSEHSVSFKNLNELRLISSHCKKIEDAQIKELAFAIGTKFQNFTSLELEFSGCTLLTKESLEFLSDKVCKKLNKLRHLNFTFTSAGNESRGPAFTRGAVINLTKVIISNLRNLESLTLNFYKSVSPKPNLEQRLDKLCTVISQSSKKLKKVTLMFDLDFHPELKYQIRKKLHHIPMLSID